MINGDEFSRPYDYIKNPRLRTCIFPGSPIQGSYINGNWHKFMVFRFLNWNTVFIRLTALGAYSFFWTLRVGAYSRLGVIKCSPFSTSVAFGEVSN